LCRVSPDKNDKIGNKLKQGGINYLINTGQLLEETKQYFFRKRRIVDEIGYDPMVFHRRNHM
jgi:hypothetical protein